MSDIQRLLRVAARRNRREEYGTLKVRLLRSDIQALREALADEGMSASVLFEAAARGFIRRHPSMLAMVQEWMRDQGLEPRAEEGRRPSNRELDEIYAAIGGGMIDDEEELHGRTEDDETVVGRDEG